MEIIQQLSSIYTPSSTWEDPLNNDESDSTSTNIYGNQGVKSSAGDVSDQNQISGKSVKIVFIILIFLVATVSALIPLKYRRLRNSTHALGLANTFSGGVFLAIAFVHIIPETARTYYLWILAEENQLWDKTHP